MKIPVMRRLRRIFAILTCSAFVCLLTAACTGSGAAPASGWQGQVGQLRMAVKGDEADPSHTAGWDGFRRHIAAFSGLEPRIIEASDYNGVIQALSAGQVDLAVMGAGSYANVDAQVGGKALPILTIRQAEGTTGYYSALMVRSNSPFRTLQDLRGRKIAYVDFNSTSGYIFPRHAMKQQGLDPDRFFASAIMAGGATQALMALVNGRVDGAMMVASAGTPETGFAAGSHITLARKGLLKLSDLRTVWTAGPIPNVPYVIRSDRPKPFLDVMRGTLAMLPYEAPEAWEQTSQTAGSTFAPVTRAFYAGVIALHNREIAAHRGGTAAK